MKLAVKIILASTLGIVLIVGIFAFLTSYTMKKSLSEKIGESQLITAKETMNKIDRAIFNAYQDIIVISEAEDFEDYLVSGNIRESINTLDEFTSLTGPWDLLLLIDEQGMVLLSTDETEIGEIVYSEEEIENKIAYESAMQDNVYYSDLLISKETGNPTIIFAAPIKNEEKSGQPIVGAVIGQISWQVVIDILEELDNAEVILLNKKGIGIGEGKEHNIDLTNNFISKKVIYDVEDFSKNGEHTEIHERGININDEVLSSVVGQKGYLNYKGNGWILVLDTTTEDAFSSLKKIQTEIIIVTIILLILGSLISLFISRSITKPIKQLQLSADKIAHGDLDEPIDIQSKDEIGELGESFDNMRYSMRMVLDEYEGMRRDQNEIANLKAKILELEKELKLDKKQKVIKKSKSKIKSSNNIISPVNKNQKKSLENKNPELDLKKTEKDNKINNEKNAK